MDEFVTLQGQLTRVPATDDLRNLANLPSEILQILFRLLFQAFTVTCLCDKLGRAPHFDSPASHWQILVTNKRFHTEGLAIYYSSCTLYAMCLTPTHLPSTMVTQLKTIRLISRSTLSRECNTELGEVGLEHFTAFSSLMIIKLPELEI